MLDQEDENVNANDGGNGAPFIHIISLNQTVECCTNEYQSEEELFMHTSEIKIQDWTGLHASGETLNFALSKKNILFVSTPSTLCAADISLENLTQVSDTVSINAI